MGTVDTILSSNIVMLAILALLVVAGLAVSLIAIALATIRSNEGEAPQQPADISKAEQRRRRLERSDLPSQRSAPEQSPGQIQGQTHERLTH
ncbi:hypothetical protein [Streptosporangium sp. NPDC000239]|uniref:hypothetical protein n=1 Tax=unclassified Streptosporangium TaxID=2632669 RepID=UPI00331CA785